MKLEVGMVFKDKYEDIACVVNIIEKDATLKLLNESNRYIVRLVDYLESGLDKGDLTLDPIYARKQLIKELLK